MTKWRPDIHNGPRGRPPDNGGLRELIGRPRDNRWSGKRGGNVTGREKKKVKIKTEKDAVGAAMDLNGAAMPRKKKNPCGVTSV